MRLRGLTLAFTCVFFGLASLAAAPASAEPAWNLEIHHNQTNFPPGGAPVEPTLTTTTQGSVSADEVQRLHIPASAGSFNLTFEGDTTADLPYNASAATVESALRALPAIGSPNVEVGASRGLNITFTGALAKTDVSQLVAASADSPNGLRRGPELWFDVANVGPTASSETLTLTIELPSTQMSRNSIRVNNDPASNRPDWSCPGSAGQTTIVCTTSDPIPRRSISRGLIVLLDIAPTAAGDRFVSATLEYDGQDAPPAAGCASGIAACATELVHISPDPAPFGILEGSFGPDFTEADGITPMRAAGSRPTLFKVPFGFTSVDSPIDFVPNLNPFARAAAESIRNLAVDLPPGFVGNPTAVAECPAAAFALKLCPPESQVGRLDVRTANAGSTASPTSSFTNWTVGVFNLVHPKGRVADLGVSVFGNPIHVRASLDPARGYAVTTDVPNINETAPPFDQKLTLWGVPADPSHDAERCPGFNGLGGGQTVGGDTSVECASSATPKPFITLPAQCESELAMRLHSYDSWQDPGDLGPPVTHEIGQFTDCADVPFDPEVTVAPTTNAAGSASGLDVTIELPQNEDCEQITPAPPAGELQFDCGTATSPLKDATVTLPEGLTVNPASANGLAACTEAQIGLGTNNPVTCPNGSKIASVEVTTPVLADPIDGLVFLATPFENPFDSLLAGYIVLADPPRGLLVKIPGKIEVDEDTGQITGIFNDNPQLPFSEFDLHFKGGAHSTLITPETCGTYTANASFAPWSGTSPVTPDSSFSITQAPGGGACPTSESSLPHDPDFDAGTVTPIAGRHSPFVVNLRREDGTQRFSEVTVSPPPGLTAKLAGTPYCPDSAISAAESRDGKAEQAGPSCPAASEIGKVWAAAGAGPSPYWTQGSAYLAGPYKGAPLSMAIVTPALAGPFDLGVVVIRTALHVDPVTAEITAVSDPIPEFLKGIPLEIKAASIRLNRPEFTLNSTSCDPMAVTGILTSTLGQDAELFNRFQLGECRRLGFKPKLYLRLFGKRFGRSSNPRLRAVLVPREGDANIARSVVRMPTSLLLDQDHIRTICTRAQFATDSCPARSVYGFAAATTPLLDDPLRGPVYLRSSENPLPDLVADLRGQVRVEVAGRTDSVKGALRNTFDIVPDAPVSKFVLLLQGGNKSLLVASRNLCRGVQRAFIGMNAHNGRVSRVRQPIAIPRCKRIRQAAKRRAMKRKRARQRAGNRGARRGARRASISMQRAVR